MNNDLTYLSYTLYNNPGVQALFLGSGVSRNAGIPTGWEIIEDQIKQLAVVHKEDPGKDPARWYCDKFGKEPDYSEILESITSTPEERINLLKRYFEPTEEEFEEGLKRPTKAHQAIAKLIKAGTFKVVVTTNFDRLLENALKDEGIEAVVISNASQIENVQPIVHNKITIVKINGDYLDTKFLNIKSELTGYDERMNVLLTYIFENFGLITVGWSSVWDLAIVDLLKSSNKFRYSNCFTFKGKAAAELEDLFNFRQGNLLGINDADSFFSELMDNIDALTRFNTDHPLTLELAIAKVKKFVVKEEFQIQLHDMIISATDDIVSAFVRHPFPPPTEETFKTELEYLFNSLYTLNRLLSTGIYWGKNYHHKLWLKVIKRFANPVSRAGSYHMWGQLERLPVLVLLYTAGISSILAEDFDFLGKLLTMKQHDKYGDKDAPMLEDVNPISSLDNKYAQLLYKPANRHTPTSDLLFERLQQCFYDLGTDEFQYIDVFDYFEYTLSLLYVKQIGGNWFPLGRFGWRAKSGYRKETILTRKEKEAAEKKESFELVNPLLFENHPAFEKAHQELMAELSTMRYF